MNELSQRYGSAKRPERSSSHSRPDGMSDDTVAALGKLSAALETAEHARGQLFAFHRLCGSADLTLQDAVTALRAAGHGELADEIADVLVGRDVIAGRWSFELIEDYESGYWSVFRDVEQTARERLGDAEPHIYEAEMKRDEQQGNN